MSFPSSPLPRLGVLNEKSTVHWNTPNPVHRPTTFYKAKIKTEIDIYYTPDILYFFQKNSKVEFQDIRGDIIARKPAILVCFGLCIVTKHPYWD